jgi:hypothetical protein
MDKKLVQMKSMIHDATVVNAARNDGTDWKQRNLTLFFSAMNA